MNLDELRQKIDAIDTEVIRLLNERADLAHEVGMIKKSQGLEIYAPEREEKLLRRLVAKGEGGRLPETAIRAIYREIMSAALALEEELEIAYLGPAGTWTHQAAVAKFGNSVTYLPQTNLGDVFALVARGEADYGVAPTGNSIEGAERDILRFFEKYELKICAQISLPIEICAMAKGPLDEIRRLYGHPSIIAAIRHWISRHGADWECLETASTAEASARALHDPQSGAVGSRLAAELYGLTPVALAIEDETTEARFSVMGRRWCPPTGDDQTLLTVGGEEMGRNLTNVLKIFESRGVETIRVDGHETGGSGEGVASLVRAEVRGHAEDPPLADAIRLLRENGKQVTVFGSYPRSRPRRRDG